MLPPNEYFTAQYDETHIKTVIKAYDIKSLYGLIEEYGEHCFNEALNQAIKNGNCIATTVNEGGRYYEIDPKSILKLKK